MDEAIDMNKIAEFRDEIVDKFGTEGLWTALFLLVQIDMETWTFPDYLHSAPVKEIAEFIENSEKIKNVFVKGDHSDA